MLLIKQKKCIFDILGTHENQLIQLSFNYSDNREKKFATSDIRENPLSQNIQPLLKLPQIVLPNCNDSLKDWPHFKGMFQSQICNLINLMQFDIKLNTVTIQSGFFKPEPIGISTILLLSGQNC